MMEPIMVPMVKTTSAISDSCRYLLRPLRNIKNAHPSDVLWLSIVHFAVIIGFKTVQVTVMEMKASTLIH